jgi:hypothetical protein
MEQHFEPTAAWRNDSFTLAPMGIAWVLMHTSSVRWNTKVNNAAIRKVMILFATPARAWRCAVHAPRTVSGDFAIAPWHRADDLSNTQITTN